MGEGKGNPNFQQIPQQYQQQYPPQQYPPMQQMYPPAPDNGWYDMNDSNGYGGANDGISFGFMA